MGGRARRRRKKDAGLLCYQDEVQRLTETPDRAPAEPDPRIVKPLTAAELENLDTIEKINERLRQRREAGARAEARWGSSPSLAGLTAAWRSLERASRPGYRRRTP